MKLSAKIYDLEQGRFEVVLNSADASEWSLFQGDRVLVSFEGREVVSILDLSSRAVGRGEIGVFSEVVEKLKLKESKIVELTKINLPKTTDYIKKKLDRNELKYDEIRAIFKDLMEQRLTSEELATFISALYLNGSTENETIALIDAIMASGKSFSFKKKNVLSLHSVGGVAGDRVTMVVVPILASLGFIVPKTAARAISSASGTADSMEVLCRVDLSFEELKKAVEKTNGCVAWGGSNEIAPADDRLIKIRYPLHLDPTALLLSSILAKKKAEGANLVLLDLPVGKGSKLETIEAARELGTEFEHLAGKIGIELHAVVTDGSSPASSQIGPALEAQTVLKALEGKTDELVEKSCLLAGLLLFYAKFAKSKEHGYELALKQITSGKALKKFKEIIKAQGGNDKISFEKIAFGKFTSQVLADRSGRVTHIDNKAISALCRAVGCPGEKKAGMILKKQVGDKVKKGDVLFELIATSKEKADFALSEAKKIPVYEIEKILIEEIGANSEHVNIRGFNG